MDCPKGPQLLFSDRLHADKYRLPHENFRESINRSASALKDDDDHFHQLRPILLDMRFMFGGRIQAAMGAARSITPYHAKGLRDGTDDADGWRTRRRLLDVASLW